MKLKASTLLLLLTITIIQLISKVACQLPDPLNPLPNTESVSSTSILPTQTTTVNPTKPTTPITTSDTSVVTTPDITSSPSSQSTIQPSVPESSTTIPSSSSQTTTPSSTPSSTHPSSSSVLPTTQPNTTSKPTTSSKTAQPSSSSTSQPNQKSPLNTTPIIVGSVVGGIAFIALIVGILAFISRRGGCTKRADRNKKSDFDDYGLADFPTHRNPAQEANPATAHNVSPTIPRLNEQGNYYNDNYNNYNYPQDEYAIQSQQHGGYYYPQQNHQQGYYENEGYYYDGSPGMNSNGGYPLQSHMQQTYNPQSYGVDNGANYVSTQQNIHKPDDISPAGADKKNNR
ncbi:hypothetical protein BY458DRAFT_503106 [Sporodiniella umbellata]|nr:hypothetical protein BY458DRAFT_503106 [Sporodiniella umbellata]